MPKDSASRGQPFERVRSALEAAGSRRQGATAWTCPSHDDQQASLSLKEGRDGAVLLKCHTGCDTEAVVKALGLAMADLFPPKAHAAKRELVAAYDYVDKDGRLLFQAVRWSPRQFQQRRRAQPGDPPGKVDRQGWVWSLGKTRRVLYRLPAVLAAVQAGETVWVAEGEKDVHALEAKGVTATCNPMGAGKWRDAYAEALAGATVVVVADRDQPGLEHARTVASSLERAGCVVRLVLPVPDHNKADAHDHLAAGHGLDDFLPLEEEATGPRAEVERDEGAVILAEVEAALRRYVAYANDHQAVAVALWIAHTHAVDAADTTPYLYFSSAEPESGKTRNLEVAELLVARPWMVVEPSEAVVFRKIAAHQPTLLLDEVDAIWGKDADKHDGLRAILNAGYRRGAMVPRCVGNGAALTLEDFPVFGAKALAGLRELPRTLASRSIPIRLQRRAKGEKVERFRQARVTAEIQPLREWLAGWAGAAAKELAEADPAIPEALSDRQADCWEPLLAIADAAGGDWPQRARTAAVELHGHDPAADPSLGVLLLGHIREAFEGAGADRLETSALLKALVDRDDGPWAEWWGPAVAKGELKAPGARLAKLLKQYGITPKAFRGEAGTARGYALSVFTEVFDRYLEPREGASQTKQRNRPGQGTFGDVTENPPVTSPQASDQQSYVVSSGMQDPGPDDGTSWSDVPLPGVDPGDSGRFTR